MKIFRFMMEESRGLLIGSLVAGVISGAANSALLALIHNALSEESLPTSLLFWGFLGVATLLPVMKFASEMTLNVLNHKAVFRLRTRLCRQILSTPMRVSEKVGPSRLLSSLIGDVQTLTGTLGQIPMYFVQLTVVVGCLLYLGWLSWQLALGVLGIVVFGFSTYKFAEKRARVYTLKIREQYDSLYQNIRALTDGIKELKLHRARREAFYEDHFRATADSLRRDSITSGLIYVLAASWTRIVFFTLLGTVIFVLPAIAEVSKDTVKGFALLLTFMIVPIGLLASVVATISRASIALQKIREVGLDLEAATENDQVAPLESNLSWSRLEFCGVSHAYHREDQSKSFALGPLDVEFAAGDLIFITGGNGSGKTTLAKILTGLYFPQSGEIRLDGEPITDENRDSYRQFFSAIFWDYHLFESLLGIQKAKIDDHVGEYLSSLRIDNKVKIDEDGRLSTTELSAGQRKRLALLTAYLEDRPIYVFDEWAADQDPHFKEVFYYQILPDLQSQGKTVFVISHDDRYYDVANHVVKLVEGQVAYDRHVS